MSAARLTGTRMPYAAAPERVRAWVARTLPVDVAEVVPRSGGMSPAVASTLVLADGRRAFVKAVGPEVHADTPTHFRHEIRVLEALAQAPWRARLLGTYDDGDWCAILMEDVPGGHPDWGDATMPFHVLESVLAQRDELTPVPAGLPEESLTRSWDAFLHAFAEPAPGLFAVGPRWLEGAWAELARSTDVARHAPDSAFANYDVRHDNILLRADRQPVFVDWGMSRRGPGWTDVVVLALEWVDGPVFDELLDAAGLTTAEQSEATGFVAGAGALLLGQSLLPAEPALPNLPAFRRGVALACLEGGRRRLGLPRR